jgi:hypothetical protein
LVVQFVECIWEQILAIQELVLIPTLLID